MSGNSTKQYFNKGYIKVKRQPHFCNPSAACTSIQVLQLPVRPPGLKHFDKMILIDIANRDNSVLYMYFQPLN